MSSNARCVRCHKELWSISAYSFGIAPLCETCKRIRIREAAQSLTEETEKEESTTMWNYSYATAKTYLWDVEKDNLIALDHVNFFGIRRLNPSKGYKVIAVVGENEFVLARLAEREEAKAFLSDCFDKINTRRAA